MPSRSLAIATVWPLMLIAGPTLLQAQDPVPRYPDNYKVLLENEHVRVLDFRLRQGDTEAFHQHPAHVLYVLEPFRIKFRLPGGRTAMREAKAGDVLYSEAVTHSPTNVGDTDAHGILIELKDGPGSAGAAPAAAAAAERPGSERTLTAVTFVQGQPGKGEEVKRELLSLTEPTRAEPGAIRYELYQSADRPDRFMRLEVWRDAEALEAHKRSPHLKASFERRKDAGWLTEITRWNRVPEEVSEEQASLAGRAER
jgi:quinol monooxygenase YgiN/quercetin dioxygenase-like cupin family protein